MPARRSISKLILSFLRIPTEKTQKTQYFLRLSDVVIKSWTQMRILFFFMPVI